MILPASFYWNESQGRRIKREIPWKEPRFLWRNESLGSKANKSPFMAMGNMNLQERRRKK